MVELVAAIGFVLLVPVFLFAGNLLWMATDPGTYQRAFFAYGGGERTGLSHQELEATVSALVAHFRQGTTIDLHLVRNGQTVPLFTEREIVHLEDVHHLVSFGWRTWGVLAAFFACFALAGLRWWRRRYAAGLARYLLLAAGTTLGLLAALGLITAVAFDQLFVWFHVVSFPNDFWILDPSQHYLINLFPQEFFLHSTLMVAGMTAGEAILLALAASVLLWWENRRGTAGTTPRP